MTAATDAVEIYRRLATANPDAHEPDLAGALNNLGNRLAEAGRREEALSAATAAVEILRRLYSRWPDAFREDLAGAERNLRDLAPGRDPNEPGRTRPKSTYP